MLLESRLGLSPWDVLNQGIAKHTPLSFGIANTAVALVVLVVAWRLGAAHRPRDGRERAPDRRLRRPASARARLRRCAGTRLLAVRALVLVAGILVIGVASALYIGAALGAGPRDSLMLVLARRAGRRVGVARTVIESAVTVVGFALGGKVGVGTLAFALGIGPSIELSFWLLGALARSLSRHSRRSSASTIGAA